MFDKIKTFVVDHRYTLAFTAGGTALVAAAWRYPELFEVVEEKAEVHVYHHIIQD